MNGLFKHVDADGNVTFSDRPPDMANTRSYRPGEPDGPPTSQQQRDRDMARQVIKKAPTIIPTVEQYLGYLDYLRHHSPVRLNMVLSGLKRTDPKTWLALQKFPQFRPLHDTVMGLKAGEKNMTAVVGIVAADLSGAPDIAGPGKKWLETTLKDLMKRDRFGPFSGVLTETSGGAASTARKALANDLAYNAKASAASATGLRASTAALRAGGATAVSRVGGGVLDPLVRMLDPEVATSFGIKELSQLRSMLSSKNILDEIESLEVHNLLAAGKYKEAKQQMDAAVDRHVFNR